jgi:hypothetical protein
MSISGGGLRLEDAVFSDAAPSIVTSYRKVHNGIEVVARGSAAAVLNTIAGGATWTWPLGKDALGRVLAPPVNLAKRLAQTGAIDRFVDRDPTRLGWLAGFASNANPKLTTIQAVGFELGRPAASTTALGCYTCNAAAVYTRGAGVLNSHTAGRVTWRPHTHVQIAQVRTYPFGANGELSAVPSTNAQGTTLAFDMSGATHFFLAMFWLGNTGVDGTTVVVDPYYEIDALGLAA